MFLSRFPHVSYMFACTRFCVSPTGRHVSLMFPVRFPTRSPVPRQTCANFWFQIAYVDNNQNLEQVRNKCTNAGVRPPLMSAINETWRNYCARSLHRNRGFCAYLIWEAFKYFSKSRWIHAFAIENKMQCNVKTCRHGCVLEADS